MKQERCVTSKFNLDFPNDRRISWIRLFI